jgi:hypothetical protein
VGPRIDTYHMAEISMRRDELKLDAPLDVKSVIEFAGVPPSSLGAVDNNYSVAKASPLEAARVMNAIFRHFLGIRPHTGEGDDYAIGAEW